MPYQPNELLFNHFRDNGIDLSKIDEQLQLVAPNSPNLPLYRDMMLTILRMAHDDTNRWNAKITLQALRELDHSFRTLERYKGRRKVTVSARRVRHWNTPCMRLPVNWAPPWHAPT